ERLLLRLEGRRPVGLIITSTIDPVWDVHEVFLEERNAIYSTAIPEVDLNRLSLLLTRMRRCYTRLGDSDPWAAWLAYDPGDWPATLGAETAGHAVLTEVARDI